MEKVEKIIRRIIEFSGILAVFVLVTMMMLTVIDVFLRYCFSRPIVGSQELIVLLMVCVVFLGLGWCTLNKNHIKVDIIESILSRKSRIFLDSINYILVLALSLFIIKNSFSHAMYIRQLNRTTEQLFIPEYPFILVVVFGYIMLFLATIILQRYVNKE